MSWWATFVMFGGQAAVQQFVRIGEGAMIVGMSGVRADVIPWGLVQGPLADLIGINGIGMHRRGLSRDDIQGLWRAYQAMFFGDGTFRERVEKVATCHGSDARVARMIEFIRGGTRPLMMAIHRSEAADDAHEWSRRCGCRGAGRNHLRRRHIAVYGGRGDQAARSRGVHLCAARLGGRGEGRPLSA